MNIVVIAGNYPSPENPQNGTFVYNIVQEYVKLNNRVTVISTKSYKLSKAIDLNYGNDLATVIRPKTLSFSNIKIGKWSTFTLTRFFQSRAIRKAVSNLPENPDVIYCHFIVSALHYLQAFPNPANPVFVAVGEYDWIDSLKQHYDDTFYFDALAKVKGFIAVSPMVKEKLISMGIPAFKIIVEPNGTDLTIFKPRDKNILRKKYNLPTDKKIVLFVGGFKEEKGPLRVQEALDDLPDDVRAVFLGKGTQQPHHPKILFTGAVKREQVAHYMALSDVFVLPTVHEGSSNVIVEAMASGLPIVSSDLPEIHVQCNPDFSILVNPMSVKEIASALNKILNDETLRERMGMEARIHSKNFDIRKRAKRILGFINKMR